jgi:prepilin-type N-terminal cleavage/methylation domain-containing protein
MRAEARAGFTLLEIAVALAILGVGVVTCLEIFSASLRIQDRASRETRAVLAGRAAMDALLFQPEISVHSECRASAEGYKTCVEVRHAGPQDGIETDDSDMGIASDVSLRYLQVDVYWQDATGAKTYTLKSLRAAPEDE